MTPETREWLKGLRDHAAGHRTLVREQVRPRAEIASERAILATSLSVWLDTELPGLLIERSAEAGSVGQRGPRPIDPEAAIVITTTVPGIDVAEDLLGRDEPLMRQLRDRFACVTELEYRRFCMKHPDDEYRLHFVHWSWMKTRVPRPWWSRFDRWPLSPGECYWLHRTGTAGAGAERSGSHLWKWTGTTAAMLKAFVDEGRRRT